MDGSNDSCHRKGANKNMKGFNLGKCLPVLKKKTQVNAAPDCKTPTWG